ncbi:DUF1349 domain-containing protein [Halorhabdus rudnickae]|nr:DUF1349 domain-containing protein [Halorhabdus rudnickae]
MELRSEPAEWQEDDPEPVSVRIQRADETVETSISVDGESYTMLRQG